MHYFDRNAPTNKTDEAVLEFLDREQFNCNKTHIEYWYQAYESSDTELMLEKSCNQKN
jgi:hypothetical protein